MDHSQEVRMHAFDIVDIDEHAVTTTPMVTPLHPPGSSSSVTAAVSVSAAASENDIENEHDNTNPDCSNRSSQDDGDGAVSPLLREWIHPPVAPAIVLADDDVTLAATEGGDTATANITATSTAQGLGEQSLNASSHDDTTDTDSGSMMRNEAAVGLGLASAAHMQSQMESHMQSASQTQTQSPAQYSYPVATFVRDLVGRGMDQIQIYADGHSIAQAQAQSDPSMPLRSNYFPSLSIRSEGGERSGNNNQDDGNGFGFASATVRTLNDLDMDAEDAEFILVDGDLIAVPPAPLNEEERDELEYMLRHRNHENNGSQYPYSANYNYNAHQCQMQPSRVRRGVHKIGKWMKKRRAGRNRHGSHDNNMSVTTDTATTTDTMNINNNNNNIPTGIPTTTLAVPAPNEPLPLPPLPSSLSRRSARSTGSHTRPLSRGTSAESMSDEHAHAQLQHYQQQLRQQLQQHHQQHEQQQLQQSQLQHQQQSQHQQSQQSHTSASPKRGRNNRRQRRSWRRTDSATSDPDDLEQEGNNNRTEDAHTHQSLSQSQSLPSSSATADPLSVSFSGLNMNMNLVSSSLSLPLMPPPAGIGLGMGIPSMMPIHEASSGSASSRAQSVTASFVGTVTNNNNNNGQGQGQVFLEAGVLPASMALCAEAYIEVDDEKKDDGGTVMMSLVPPDADYKVDKASAPDVESMLRRAAHETKTDLAETSNAPESSCLLSPLRFRRRGKSDGSSIPLSQAVPGDLAVHNDILKIVMVAAPHVDKSTLARAIREKKGPPRKRATLGVDVHTWQPDETSDVKCQIWDVQGATTVHFLTDSANFGAHAGTQSLFFSAKSLYLLVWDLAASNPKTMRHEPGHVDDSDDDDDEDNDGDDFLREEANRQADRALYADIQANVLSWVDCIARRGPNSGILPIAVIPQGMAEEEVKRRCDMMQNLLERHVQVHRFAGDVSAPKLLTGADSMLCVDYSTEAGVTKVQEMILSIATDSSRSVFEHVGTPVPRGTLPVLEMTRRLKQDHKLILLDHFLGELGEVLTVEEVVEALHFLSSIGEILYFGTADDDVLSRYIILSRKWLVSALSCILRNDLKRELTETRRFMNMQCIYSDQKYSEHDITKALVSGTASSCPLLSDNDANMLWQSMSFMREAADKHSQLAESSTTTPTMFYFLERLLVHSGIFLPLGTSSSSLDHSNVFFVPSLLAQADPRDVWTYKSSESWMTTLCHSWLFRDGAPSHLMEHVTVSVLKGLYEFSRSFNDGRHQEPPHRSQTLPVGRSSFHDFLEEHDEETIGRVKINHIMCWKSSLLVKISCVIADQESGELRESFVEVFVSVVDQSSSHCVASDAMRASMQRVVVSGKGQIGHQGRKLWKGGYQVVLDSVRQSLDSYTNVDSQVVCPECLAHSSPHSASTWSWDSVLAVAESGNSVVRCMRGHRVNSNLICGTCTLPEELIPAVESAPSLRTVKAVSEVLPTVVLVGLWDTHNKNIRNVGSGFVVDKKLGLVVTAGHILFNMKEGREFGSPYFGLQNAKVVIGVIPDGHDAVFRYFAEIVAEDIHNVDACVLQITTRLENDVSDVGSCADQDEMVIDDIPKEQLKSLKITSKVEIEESVRILGFNQGGEGVFEQGKHVNRSADFARGYVVKKFRPSFSDDSSSHSSDSSSQLNFSPREEIVIMCPTISGHSGGPCVNDDGKVVGILSRADPVDRQRCYLVPSTELKILVNQAKKQCTRPTMLKSMQSM